MSKKKQSDLKLYLRLMAYVKPYSFYFIISVVGYFIYGVVQPMLANILRYFIDFLNGNLVSLFPSISYLDTLSPMIIIPCFVIIIVIWQGIGSFLGDYYIAKVSHGVIQDLRNALFKKVVDLPCEYYDKHKSSRILSLLLYNVDQITGSSIDAIKVIFKEGFTVFFLFLYLMYMNSKLTLVMLLTLPFITLIVVSASRKLRKYSKDSQEAIAELIHVTTENIKNYRTVRVFRGAEQEKRRFYKVVNSTLNKMLRLEIVSNSYTPILQIIMYAAMAILLFIVLFFWKESEAGELVAYITAAGLLPKPVRQLSEVSETIQKGLASAESIFQVFDSDIELDNGTYEKQNIEGRLDVKNLSFTYPGTDNVVLEDISFTVDKGKMVALVGKSGSGKTTLSSLILRFYNYDKGQILLDGVKIDDYRLQNFRSHFSYVSQQVTLFNDTIFNNIAYGELAGATFEQVEMAAISAYADEFIKEFAQGYHTLIGENGVKLSGGQRQRLAIARAFLKNPKIIILDEATSALDNESEFYVKEAINKIMEKRTTIVIAHRLSTIEKADKIIVLDDRKIIETGTHEVLLSKQGIYQQLYELGIE